GVGVAAGGYDGSGRLSLIIGNFSNEMMALYHNEGNGLFIDEAPTSAIGRASLLTLTFGCFFFDYDLDGRPDIFAANGHVADDINRVQSRVTYAERTHFVHNIGTRVELMSPGGGTQWQIVKTGSSYASQSELPLTFGLGSQAEVAGMRVKWPSGRVDSIGRVKANQTIVVKEGAGIIAATPFRR